MTPSRRIVGGAILGVCLATPSFAQTWSGAYVGGSVGAAVQRDDAAETVTFDTNLDRAFGDTVRTAAGADAFSPGFCGGIAAGPLPSTGCADDEDGVDLSARAGYDWQFGRVVVGGVGDVARVRTNDGVSAFSTTPAFYAFSREMTLVTGVRARAGVASARVLAYGTGGRAWGRLEQRFTTSNGVNTFVPGADTLRRETSGGYQGGGGMEIRLRSAWRLSAEYLFTSLDDTEASTVRAQGPAPATNPFILTNPSGTDLVRTDRFEMHSLRVGILYHF